MLSGGVKITITKIFTEEQAMMYDGPVYTVDFAVLLDYILNTCIFGAVLQIARQFSIRL